MSDKVVAPAEIYSQAESFFRALDNLHKTYDPKKFSEVAVPSGVLSAFASELFLKYLVLVDTGKASNKTHLLYDLFLQLSPATQKRLEEIWDEIVALRKDILDKIDAAEGTANPRDLRSNLKDGTDGFRLLRYVYEGGADFTFTLGDLPLVLRHHIGERGPPQPPGPKP